MNEIVNRSKYKLLKHYFGYTEFREGQEEIIDAIIDNRDVVAIMPTGGGKSVCFQLPALMMSGITIVVSPLISLMTDQVQYLNKIGIKSVYINSSLEGTKINEILKQASLGLYKLVYVSPERLMQEKFMRVISKAEVSMLVVDEAHCISHWGHDFRPEYSRVNEFISCLSKRPVVAAFTSTATRQVRQGICNSLQLNNPLVFISGFNRENLCYEVLNPSDKFKKLCELLDIYSGKSIIVYCLTRAIVEEIHDNLNQKGILSAKYHAGMSLDERRMNQDDFQNNIMRIMVATNAYGMGVNKSDISVVIHYNMPQSVENYYQESGRAGRNGCDSKCIILYSTKDIRLNSYLIEKNSQKKSFNKEKSKHIKKENYRRLSDINHYCMTSECLKKTLLNYFDEKNIDNCGKCSNCLRRF